MVELPEARIVKDGGPRPEASAPLPPRLQLAPRTVPLALVVRVWFGTTFATIGWLLACVGMVFTLVFLPRAALVEPDYDRVTSATITRVEKTSHSENDDDIYRVHFTFDAGDGVTRSGVSYTTAPPAEGAHQVEYIADDPATSRLLGMRTQPYSRGVLFVLIFPLIGLGIAISQLATGVRATRLLRYGVETRGTLLSKKETSTTVNDDPVMALTFEYLVDRRPYQVTVKTLHPALLEDDAQEPMLYDPRRPARATTLDHLPGAPRITADGQIASSPDFATLAVILPLATVVLLVATVATLAGR